MIDSHCLQLVILQEFLHDIHLTHGVAYRCSRGKYHASPATVNFRYVLAFKKHVHCFFGAGAAYSRYIVHFGIDCQILVIVGFINK